MLPLVKFWELKGSRYYVIELPDRSHARIPASWADDGQALLVGEAGSKPLLTVEALRELAQTIHLLLDRSSFGEDHDLSSLGPPPKEVQRGPATRALF